VEAALEQLFSAEHLDGVFDGRSGREKREVAARKRELIAVLPRTLILCLKRFNFDLQSGQPIKINKAVEFGERLDVRSKWLAGETAARAGRRYSLQAVLSHHGSQPVRGHYTADVKGNGDVWWRLDDERVRITPIAEVLSQPAYLLVYTLMPNEQ